jgi:hypothetical protein
VVNDDLRSPRPASVTRDTRERTSPAARTVGYVVALLLAVAGAVTLVVALSVTGRNDKPDDCGELIARSLHDATITYTWLYDHGCYD